MTSTTTAARDELTELAREIAHTLAHMSQQLDTLARGVADIREGLQEVAGERTRRRPSPDELDGMYQQMAAEEQGDPEYQQEMAEWLNAPLGPYRHAGEATS